MMLLTELRRFLTISMIHGDSSEYWMYDFNRYFQNRIISPESNQNLVLTQYNHPYCISEIQLG
jgi:hypothetical protein